MSEFLYISYPVACSFALVAITSVILNIWTMLRSMYSPGVSSSSPQEVNNAPSVSKQHKLQPGQWSSEATFGLERRAILSQRWICVSHVGRFTKPGDYITLDFAGFKLFLIMGKDNIVRAFHNVCRHRAFPITRKAAGSATLLGCRYHGWSYDTKGQLTKAPQFDQLPGFDKAANGLFEINTKTDAQGFIHMNLNSSKPVDTNLAPPMATGRPLSILPQSTFLRSWEIHGNFNWKSYVLDRAQDAGIDAMSTHGLHFTGQLRYDLVTTVYTDSKSSIWFQLVFVPSSAEKTTIRCDAFASSPADARRFNDEVESKLEGYLNGRADMHERNHPSLLEKSIILSEFWFDIRKIIESTDAHYEREKAGNAEIDLSSVQQCRSAAFEKAEGICKAMEGANAKLDW